MFEWVVPLNVTRNRLGLWYLGVAEEVTEEQDKNSLRSKYMIDNTSVLVEFDNQAFTRNFSYTYFIKISTIGCYFLNPFTGEYSTDGCMVNVPLSIFQICLPIKSNKMCSSVKKSTNLSIPSGFYTVFASWSEGLYGILFSNVCIKNKTGSMIENSFVGVRLELQSHMFDSHR